MFEAALAGEISYGQNMSVPRGTGSGGGEGYVVSECSINTTGSSGTPTWSQFRKLPTFFSENYFPLSDGRAE